MSEQLDDLLHDARKKLERGAPKQALKRLDRARSLAPEDPDVLEVARALDPRSDDVLADAHDLVLETIFCSPEPRKGAFDAAGEAARDLGESHPVSLLGKGRALFYSARFAEALEPLRAAAEREKKNPTPPYFLGAALERLGKLELADEQLARAAKLDPERHVVPFRVSDEAFDAAVLEALEGLPAEVRATIDESCVVSREDFPLEARVAKDGVDPLILGEFLGASGLERQGGEAPAEVVIYRRNLEKECSTRAELVREIRTTVFHEVGHALGFDEDGVDALGLE
ncbi:metallopeptidase family protein [bacterium]|nr:metallopeptidase family protein [bacterium]